MNTESSSARAAGRLPSTPDPGAVELVRQRAARGAEGIRDLIEMLGEPSWSLRREVVRTLAELGDAAAQPLADALVTCRSDEKRVAALVDALSASHGLGAERAAMALADHENPAVAVDAAVVLGRRRARSGVETLVRLSRHHDDNVAVAALEALGHVGGRAVIEPLIEAVRTRNFFRTFPAIDVLGRTGDPRAVEPLAELTEDSRYVLEAARGLGRTGDPAAVAPLSALLARGSDTVVRVACAALGELHARHVQRFGETGAVEAQLREHAREAAVRRISEALVAAGPLEQETSCWLLGVLEGEAAVPTLTAHLEGPPKVARAAALALQRIGRAAAEAMMKTLAQGGSEVRKALLPTVPERLQGIDAVAACLDDPDAGVRAAACETLARISNPAAVRPLFQVLGDPDPRVAQSATAAIQSLGSAETEGLALRAARSERPRLRRAAFRVLAYFGYASALDLFLEGLDDDDPRISDAAIQGLAFIDDPRALESLFEAARHSEPRVRAAAMRALGNCRGDLRVDSFLLRGLGDEDGWVRYYACQSLGKVGFDAAAEAIAGLLDDPAGQVRVAAVEALAQLSGAGAREHLTRAARSEEPDVRRAALLGLGISRRPEHLPLLLDAARAKDAATRLVAVSAMSGFAAPEVLDALDRAARDPDQNVRNAALAFLSARASVEATERLVRLAADAEGVDPKPASDALAKFSPERVRGLLQALEQANDEQAPLITNALARMHRPEARRALLQALRTAPVAGRKAAVASLANLRGHDVEEALATAAVEDPDPEVRRTCAAVRRR